MTEVRSPMGPDICSYSVHPANACHREVIHDQALPGLDEIDQRGICPCSPSTLWPAGIAVVHHHDIVRGKCFRTRATKLLGHTHVELAGVLQDLPQDRALSPSSRAGAAR